jgi:hypothetical protein
MAPTPQSLHFDKALTEISVAFQNEQFIIDQIFKPIPVQKQSDRYFVYGQDYLIPVEDYRAPGTKSNEITWSFSYDTFFCDGHALSELIPDESFQNNDTGFDLESESTENIMNRLLLNKEIAGAKVLLDTTKYDADLVYTPAKKWSAADSDPVKDIETAKNDMHLKSGFAPNVLVLSRPVYNVLRMHPKLLSYFKVTEISVVTLDMIRTFLDVPQVIVASAMKSTTKEGKAVSRGYIWGENAVLAYVPARPARKTPALGYQFQWDAHGNGTIETRRIYKEEERALKIESEMWYDFKIVSNVGGAIFPGIL